MLFVKFIISNYTTIMLRNCYDKFNHCQLIMNKIRVAKVVQKSCLDKLFIKLCKKYSEKVTISWAIVPAWAHDTEIRNQVGTTRPNHFLPLDCLQMNHGRWITKSNIYSGHSLQKHNFLGSQKTTYIMATLYETQAPFFLSRLMYHFSFLPSSSHPIHATTTT